MIFTQALFIFIFGLAVGSFLNVVVYRLNNPLPKKIKKKFGGRSFCPKCKKQIVWHDNLPLVSFVFLKGRCRFCHSPISWQYPLVELATGVMTVWLIFHLQGVQSFSLVHLGGVFYYLLLVYALIVIFVSDWLYMTIPDEVVWSAVGVTLIGRALAIGLSFTPGSTPGVPGLFSFLLAALGAAGFFLALVWATRGKGMGWGDVKLALLMGLVLGWPKILLALYLAFLTGGLVGGIMILTKKKRFGQEIPFGPFLVGATLLVIFWGDWLVEKTFIFLK